MEEQSELAFELRGIEPGTARDVAIELREFLRSESATLNIEIGREDPARQDLGALLLIIAGAAGAAEAIANAIRAFSEKHRGLRLRVKSPKGELEIDNATSADVASLADAIERLVE